MAEIKGYYAEYNYVGILPDGGKVYFATEEEFKQYLREEYPDPDA